jgi:peptide/nickel transport system ATP-binding protein
MPELLKVEGLKKYFPRGSKVLKAVDDVSFTLQTGETLGLVGESGSGKSTMGRAILRLIEPNAGQVYFEGENLANLSNEALRMKRSQMQIIFQDPLASLNPQMSIGQAIEDPLIIHGIGSPAERKEIVGTLLDVVEIGRQFINSFPYEFSGGQQQRVGIARALALNPKFIVCDEPVSALDVSIQAQIISLLTDLREKYHLAYLFIAHDLGVIKYISDRIAVMYLGRIVQLGPKEEIFKNPAHPYTRAIISSVPRIPRHGQPIRHYETLKGEIPSPIDLPPGCRFRSRCPAAKPQCEDADPALKEISSGHWVACHLA